MWNSRLARRRTAFGAAILVSCLLATGCASGPPKWRMEGSTYIDETYNCKISAVNDKWSVTPQHESLGDAFALCQLVHADYNAHITLAVSKHRQANLQAFAGVGSYNPTESRFTYVAGKPCFYATKPMTAKGFTFISAGYKFVSNNRGYLLMALFPAQFTHHDGLHRQIDEVLNSFEFLRPDSDVSPGPEVVVRKSGGKLSRVAVLDLIDLKTGGPTATTRSLTNTLQDECARSGKFELVQRRDLSKILDEEDLKRAGMIKGQSAVKAGKLLGAEYLLDGNLGTIGVSWVVYLQIVDAETGEIIATASMRRRKGNEEQLLNMVSTLVRKLASRL